MKDSIFIAGLLGDTAKFEQADWLDCKYLDMDPNYLDKSFHLSGEDYDFVQSWFELDAQNPELFGYLFH